METDLLKYSFPIVRYFIPEFITRMRWRSEVLEKPSPRQSIAMCNLLLTVYLKKGCLDYQDLVEIAVHTSKVENQALAEKVANEVLLEIDDEEERPPSLDEDALLGLFSPKSDELTSYLPSETDKPDRGEPQARHDSDVDIFKEFTSQPDLGVGPGEDELVKRVIRRHKDERDEASRRRLADFLKARLLKLGRDFERSVESLQRLMLRPFEYGDDPEDIDEERSLENILDQAKRVDEVGYDDFLIRRKNRRKKAVVFILDISNTMFYQWEGLTSIHYSVMSLVPLLWSLRGEDFGVVLYESNSHVQKDLQEQGDVEELIDGLLVLVTATTGEVEKSLRGAMGARTWGGTVPNQSLKWALERLESSGERAERICVYFSDFVLEDPDSTSEEKTENYEVVRRMVDRGIHVVACVSPLARCEIFSSYSEKVLKLLKEAGCEMLETLRPSEFLDEVQRLLETY
jgi:hypothetical protein